MVGIAVLASMAAVALLGPYLLAHGPTELNVVDKLAAPSSEHLLGTDHLGRDLLSRTMDGARRTLGTATLVMGGVLAIGLGFGVLSGLAGTVIDALIMRTVDVLLALPSLVLALALVGALGPGLGTLILALTVAQAPWYIRMVRAMVQRERERTYVLVARVHGATQFAVVRRHILPAVASQVAVLATLDLGSVMLAVAGLSFLGLGVQPPQAEWGAMLGDGRLVFADRPLLMIVPGACIFVTVLAANLLGDALRDVLDPAWHRAHA